MNEEALQQLYILAQGEGYSKPFNDFKVLMSSNEDALNNMYTVAQSEGYQKNINDFKVLVGFDVGSVKKKDGTESLSEDGSLVSSGPRQIQHRAYGQETPLTLKGFGGALSLDSMKPEEKEKMLQAAKEYNDSVPATEGKSVFVNDWRLPKEDAELTEQDIANRAIGQTFYSGEPEKEQGYRKGVYNYVSPSTKKYEAMKRETEFEMFKAFPTEDEKFFQEMRAARFAMEANVLGDLETEKALEDGIITTSELDAFIERKKAFDEYHEGLAKEYKKDNLFKYNMLASSQGLLPVSEEEYELLFENEEKDVQDLDNEIFVEFRNQLGDNILTQEEIDDIDQFNKELREKGEEPLGYDFYIMLKQRELFDKNIRSKGLLPSQRKEAIIKSIIDANAKILTPGSGYGDIFDTNIDLTQALPEDIQLLRSEEIYNSMLNRDFIVSNIASEKFLENANKYLTQDEFDNIQKEATENFFADFGEQEWDMYEKISGTDNPAFYGTDSSIDLEKSAVAKAVVVGDEDATVANLKRLFPNSLFRFEGTGKAGEYITISTIDPKGGGKVKSLEIYLEQENNPTRRIIEFMMGALLTKEDQKFMSTRYGEKKNPLWKLDYYDYILSNPQKFGDRDSPDFDGPMSSITVDFNEIKRYLEKHKDKISSETMAEFERKMKNAEYYYRNELQQEGSVASGMVRIIGETIQTPVRFFWNQTSNIADALGVEGAQSFKHKMMEQLEDDLDAISGTNEESMASRSYLQTLLYSMMHSGGLMAVGAATGNPYATLGLFAASSSNSTEELLKDEDIPEYQKGLISVSMGIVEGTLESYGAQKLLNPATKGMFKRVIIDSIKDLPSDAPQEVIERAIKNNVKAYIKSGGLKIAEGMIVEGATELQQGQIYDLNQRLFNALYDKEIFQVPDWTTEEGRREWIDSMVEQFKMGALSGGGLAGVIHGTKSLSRGYKNKSANKQFNNTYNELMNNSTFQKAKQHLIVAKEANTISEEEFEVLTNQLNESREVMQSIPETLNTNRKRQAYNLLTEKRALERSMQNKSPELVASQKDRIKSIDAELKIVGNQEVAETPDVVEEFLKDKPSRMERVTRYQEIENIMKPKEAEVVTEEVVEETPTVAEEVVEETTGEEPVTEEERAKMREVLGEPLTQAITEEAAPVVEQTATQQEALETQPITKITNDLVTKEKKGELTQEETDGILLGIMEKIEAENAKRKSPLSPEQAQKKLGKMQQRVFEANKDRYLELSGVMPAAQEQVVEETAPVVEQVTEEVIEKTPPMVEKAPVKEVPKRKRRRKKVAPVVKEEVKVSEEVTTPIAKPKVVVSGTSDGYQVVSSANTTQAENESIKDARGDKTFDKDGFRITKLEDRSSQVSYKSKVRVSDKGNRPGYAMATVIIPEGSPVNKQQIQEAFDNKLSEIIESNRKKKLGAKFSELTTEQNQQLTDAVVNAISQEQAVEKAPVKKEAPKKKAPVKEETQVSEEVQKEIKRAERLRDRIVAEKANKLSKTKGFEQKEEIRAEIRQAEKKYNNIITELKEGKRAQFQLETETTSEQTKQKLEDEAVKLLEDVAQANDGKISEDPFTAEQPAPGAEIITIEVKENSELAKKVRKMGLDELVGKKINLVMADQLKVDKKRMGGPFFPLIDKLFGKVAWASIDRGAASRIINGAIESDYSVVYNMSSDGIYSNSIMGQTLIELIPAEKRAEAFELFKENILQSKSKDLKKVRGLMKVSESLEELFKELENLDVDSRAAVITKLVPSVTIDNVQTEVGKFLRQNNISLEGLVEINVEDFVANLPAGAMTMVLEVTDKAGNKVTKETKEEAFITPEQQKEEGLPQHPNYPMYIRGRAVGILKETTPFWNVIRDVAEKINQKVEGIIKRKQGFRKDITQEEKNTIDNLKYGISLKGRDSLNEAKRVAKIIRDVNAKNIGGPVGKILKDNMDLIENESSIVKIREVFEDSQNIFAKYVNTTSGLARKDAMRSAEMSASKAQEVSTPEASRYEKFVSVLRRSFPSVEVVTTQAEFDTLLKETGAKQLTTKNQKVYGAVYQGKLYLNPSLENYNTPIHEFGHVWMNVAKEANPELYKKGMSLVKGSKYEQDVLNNKAYQKVIKQMKKDGASEQEINDYIQEEALATAIGDKGESFVNASQKKNFKQWLETLYGFVRKLTGISKYTSKQLEDITLDEFTQAVAVDLLSGRQLFEGAEITDMGDALQLMAEKGVDLDAAMNEAINDMIEKGFKAAEIKGVLLQMGYKARAINDALVVNIDADMKLPNEFANIEGGVKEGEALFRSVMEKLKEFAAPKLVKRSMKEQYNEAKKDGYKGTLKEYTEEQNNKKVEMLKQANTLLTLLTNEEILKRYPNIQNEVVEKQQKSRAEIRAKAIELLEAEPAFQAQDALMQKELVVSMDKVQKSRSNKEVQKKITSIKQALQGAKEATKSLQGAKNRVKNLIKEELIPFGVSVREANKLVSIIQASTQSTYQSDVIKVMKAVEAQIEKKKKETVEKMLKLAKKKASVKNKRARTDVDAARFFKQATVVLEALKSKDNTDLKTIESKLIEKEERIYEILDDINDGLEVNEEDRNLASLAQAFDILGSLKNQDLAQHEEAFNLMKSELESGMESLRTKRAARKSVYDKLRAEADKDIKAGYDFLFDEEGQALSTSELENLSDELRQEMWNKITSIPKLLSAVNKFTKLQAQNFGKFSAFTESVKNLGTLLRGLDRKGDFLEKNIYDRLNNMEEDYLQGYFNTMDMLESELNSIGIKGGINGLNKIINKEFVIAKTLDLKGIKLDLKKSARPVVKLTRGEAMRIYALSKNADQMNRLKAQGFNEAKMQKIEEFIGPQLVKAVDITVDFLSTSYFEGINKVYEDVNDISLPYIENYFPTKTVPSKSSDAAEFDRLSKEMKSGNFAGVFSAQQASALKERTSKDAVDIKYQDFSSTLEEHIRTMERFKAYAMGTKEINIIINHTPSVKALLQVTNLQNTISDRIMAAINPNAAQQLFESSKGGKAFTFFQRQYTGITLALKPIQALKQMSSFINAWEDYSLRGQEKRIPVVDTVLDALGFSYDIAATFFLLPKVWGKYSTYNKAMYSASFKDRIRQSFKTADLLGLEAGVGARRRSKKTRLGRALRRAKVVANSPTLVGDIAGVMGYMAAYRANMRNGMSQKEAIEKFNAYNETQQTRRGTDKIGLQTNSNMYTRVFTMFGSSLFLQLNKVMQSVTKLRRASVASFKSAIKGDWKGTKENFPKEKDVRALYVNLFIANILFAAMANIFKYHPLDALLNLVMDDDDDELTEEEMEVIKKAQNALKRGKEISDEEQKLLERYQFMLDKKEVLKAYENSIYGMNQLFNLPLVGPSIQQNWDYYYWNNPNAFTTDKKSRVVNPLEQTFTKGFWDKTLNDVSESEFLLKTIISFALGVDVKRPIAMIERLQSFWGDDEMYREGFEEVDDEGERKFKGTFDEYKQQKMEENMYELMGISYSYRPGSGKDWTKKKMTITIDPKTEKKQKDKEGGVRKTRTRRKISKRKRRQR